MPIELESFVRPILASTVLALGTSTSLAAVAAEEPLRLTWTAPAGCPSTEDVRAATLRSLNARTASGVLEANAAVEQKHSSWSVHLRTKHGDATGERTIDAATCQGLADATAVILALALVPPGSTPEATVASAVAPPAPPRRSTTTSRAAAVGISVAGDTSSLPSSALGGSLTLAWTPGRLRIEVDGRRWATQSQTLPTSTAGAQFSMSTFGGRACWAVFRSASFDVAPCLGADVQFVTAPGYGADANYSASAQWITTTGGALVRQSLAPWLALRARLDGFAPLSRPRFLVLNEGSLHRPSLLGAAASFGVEALFL